jgi:hypothetical protein
MHHYKQSSRYASTYEAAYTDARKTYHTITAYTTVFLKMNPPVQNNVEDIKIKIKILI